MFFRIINKTYFVETDTANNHVRIGIYSVKQNILYGIGTYTYIISIGAKRIKLQLQQEIS